MVWLDIMEVKVLPNSSPLEGGGHMALVFYQTLPLGPKVVYFISSSSRTYYLVEQAIDENSLTLSCAIPKYPVPEEVEVRVFCDQQPIASTTFTFYQPIPTSSPELLLQMLNSQLQTQFQVGAQGGLGGATGGGATGQATYTGYIPSSMYQLLLGACRLGCEPLAFCLLNSPIMEKITREQIKEAYDIAVFEGHYNLSEQLFDLHLLHDMSTPQLLSRGEEGAGLTPPTHVPAYYDTIDQLEQGGDTPQERAQTVLKQVLAAIEQKKKEKEEKEKEKEKEKEEEKEKDRTPTVELVSSLSSDVVGDLTPVEGMKRRLSSSSRLIRQTNSISDEDEERAKPLPSPSPTTDTLKPFSPTRRESADLVTDLPQQYFRKLPINQLSDADSAIGLSFDEDGLDTSRRSSILTELGGEVIGVKVNVSQQIGMEVASSLESVFESAILVTSDYPPHHEKKLFHKGDQIVQVGDHVIRNPDMKSFSEVFQAEVAAAGTIVSILPALTDRNSTTPEVAPRLLLRTPSDQSLFSSIPPRISQLLNIKPPSQERKVTVLRSSSGCGFKLIGGKTVGIFMTEIRPDLTQVSIGDQILDINGCSIQGLTLYEANELLQQTTGNLQLTVMENKAKYSNIRDQVELDSFYLRSLVDHAPSSNREMPLKKGSLLRVVNTFHSSNYWLAWAVDEKNGVETQLKRIPTPQLAQKQFSAPAYERVHRSDSVFRRPVCVIGPSSETLVASMCANSSFKMCLCVEHILQTCNEGSQHGVLSIKDLKIIQLLSSLHPIVLQTSSDKITVKEHLTLNKVNIDASLIGDTTRDLTKQALLQVNRIQTLPLWKTMGLVN